MRDTLSFNPTPVVRSIKVLFQVPRLNNGKSQPSSTHADFLTGSAALDRQKEGFLQRSLSPSSLYVDEHSQKS